MKEIRYGPTLVVLFLFSLAGCAPFSYQHIPESFQRPEECQRLFEQLDASVTEQGVRDAASYSIPDFPYLRTNRFLSALGKKITKDQDKEEWLQRMQGLDIKAREKEISNLSDEWVFTLAGSGKGEEGLRDKLNASVKACSDKLLRHDRSHPDFYPALDSRTHVPDEYSFFMRAIGLYPVASIPVAVVTGISREKIISWHEADLNDLPVDGRLRAFVPGENLFFTEKEIEGMINESRRNALKIPEPGGELEKRLVASFAPIFIQDVAAPYDEIGRVVWKDDSLEIDSLRPTVYYYISHALLKGEAVLQINYVIWFSARAGKRPPRIERGHLDGLTLRISLDGRGRPFMADVMNNCGCYHLFAPDQRRVEAFISRPFRFGPFVPQWLPGVPPDERLGVRLNSGWHQAQRLSAVREAPDSSHYELIPYDILEALPHRDGRTESIFDANGIVKGTERAERFILFSMGIPRIGSMRQRGHHAIELIGRVHFDDPCLFDRSFVFK